MIYEWTLSTNGLKPIFSPPLSLSLTQVKKACGTPSLMQNDNLAGAYEQSAAPTLHSNKWILAPINEMLQFEMTIDKNKDLFLQLSST